jgi:hypothetical protein
LPGDFVECGVEWGFGVDVVSDYLDFKNKNKNWYLYDTFSGVPLDQRDLGFEISNEITLKDQYDKVKKKFSGNKKIKVIKGRLPDCLQEICPKKISYLHIDLNNTRAEIETFISLFPKVSLGGHIIFDDFGSMLFSKQHYFERKLFNYCNLPVLELPTGQALIIKTHDCDFHNFKNDIIQNESKYTSNIPSWPNVKKTKISEVEELDKAYQYLNMQISLSKKYFSKMRLNWFKKQKSLKYFKKVIHEMDNIKMEINGDTVTLKYLNTFTTYDISIVRRKLQYFIDIMQGLLDQQRKIFKR